MPINVSIVEDDPIIRESLEVLLNGAEGFRCASVHGSAEEALEQLPRHKPDVVLMDINLPGQTGIECARKLKAVQPGVQIMMLTMYEDTQQIFDALAAGASGYLLKRTPPPKVLEAIREVQSGESPMSGKVARIVVQHFQSRPAASDAKGSLSKREQEILDLLSKGYRYKEIAEALGISFDTVRSHLRNIYEKLQVSSRTEAVVKYLQK